MKCFMLSFCIFHTEIECLYKVEFASQIHHFKEEGKNLICLVIFYFLF